MNYTELQDIPETYPEQGKIGDRFFLGSLANQKDDKKKGDTIVYYEVISIKENRNIEYTTMFDVLSDE
jgi:hypothetical protein